MKPKCVIYALCLLVALSTTSSAETLSVTGTRFEAEVIPGEHIVHTITVKISEGDPPVDLNAMIFGYGLSLESSKITLRPDEDLSPYSATDFLKITPTQVSLFPGESKTIVLEGDVPMDVGSGGRYALVKIETDALGKGVVGVVMAVVVPVRLTVSGTDLVETGEITDLRISEDKVSAIFESTGNHHYLAGAEAVLKDEGGNVVANYSTASRIDPLLPMTSHLFEVQFDSKNGLTPGTYTVEVSVIHENGTVLDTEEAIFEV